MSELSIWQRDINKYDQHVRKMLAIRELGDIPVEVWMDLCYSDSSFVSFAKKVGTEEYTSDVRSAAIDAAMRYYTNQYMRLHTIDTFEHAEEIVNGILHDEITLVG